MNKVSANTLLCQFNDSDGLHGGLTKIIGFDLRHGGQKRAGRIVDYLLAAQPDLMVLTEYVSGESGETITSQLESAGYQCQASNQDGRHGVLVACRQPFSVQCTRDRWAEICLDELGWRLLGIYVPDQTGKEKTLFWQDMLSFAREHKNDKALMIGDFNSCSQRDSGNGATYNDKDLKALADLGWIDIWEQHQNSVDDTDRYTWYYHDGTGFRLDYLFVSPGLAGNLKQVCALHDHSPRDKDAPAGWPTDHSALLVDLVC